VKFTVALALGLAIVAGGWRAVGAFNPQPEPPRIFAFSPVTLVRGDIARVHIAYVGDPGAGQLPPGPCRYVVEFFDAEGRVRQRAIGEVIMGGTHTVLHDPPDWDMPNPGLTNSVDLDLPPSHLVRARVRILSRTYGGVQVAMEVANQATLATRFTSPGSLVGFNPLRRRPGDFIVRPHYLDRPLTGSYPKLETPVAQVSDLGHWRLRCAPRRVSAQRRPARRSRAGRAIAIVSSSETGYTFLASAVDAGEPGVGRDTFAVTINSPQGSVVLSLNGTLAGGNIQLLKEKK
jgi:hypothetical protein